VKTSLASWRTQDVLRLNHSSRGREGDLDVPSRILSPATRLANAPIHIHVHSNFPDAFHAHNGLLCPPLRGRGRKMELNSLLDSKRRCGLLCRQRHYLFNVHQLSSADTAHAGYQLMHGLLDGYLTRFRHSWDTALLLCHCNRHSLPAQPAPLYL
jgi:hypothetical protein